MQTFLPYPDYKWCAISLDRQRLGCQRKECLQILKTLEGRSRGWNSHPAVLMWKGYEGSLAKYAAHMCTEWIGRGYRDNLLATFLGRVGGDDPPWLGDERLHSSHRARLLAKDPVWYGRHQWPEQPSEGYYWPVVE